MDLRRLERVCAGACQQKRKEIMVAALEGQMSGLLLDILPQGQTGGNTQAGICLSVIIKALLPMPGRGLFAGQDLINGAVAFPRQEQGLWGIQTLTEHGPILERALLVMEELCDVDSRRVYDADNKGWRAVSRCAALC